jgi:sarcosine oxidase subunit gamma
LKHGLFRPVVEDLLARLAPLDVPLPAFPAGTLAQTGLHHVGVLRRRTSAETFEILIPVTWVATIRELIGGAAAPFGYVVKAGGYRVEGGGS